MLTMAEKTFLGLTITLIITLTAVALLPVWSYEVSLVTIPNGDSFHVPVGEPFNITCQGQGDESHKFSSLKWLDKQENPISKGTVRTQEDRNSLMLIFTDPKVEESGVYKCIAVYDKKQSLQKAVSVIFYSQKPTFKDNFETVTTTENSYLEINCSAFGEYPIVYEWFNEYAVKIKEDQNSSMFVVNATNESFLVIPCVSLNHSSLYTCKASNQHGLSSKIYSLTVLPSKDNDTNGTSSFGNALVVNITSSSVKFAFNVTGPVRYIEVLYKESRNAAEYFKEWKYGDDYEMKGLIPAGLYTFKFRTNPSDMWSRPYRVTLLPDMPDVIFRKLESGSVKLQWFSKIDNLMRRTIDKHELTYFTVQIEGGNSWSASKCNITIQIPSCAGSSYTLSGLSQNVYYEIQLKAHTDSGYGKPYKQKIYV